MSNNTFFVSDTHFGHEATCTKFKKTDGVTPLRPFANAQEMDEEMVRRWNSVVKEHDKVYHMGDVVINKKFLPIMQRLNGSKRLIRGNHDIMKTTEYQKYFKEIYGVRVLEDMILSHIPLHPESVTERFGTNVHGHLHEHRVKRQAIVSASPKNCWIETQIDPRFFSVCVEQIDFTPISYEDLRIRIKTQQDEFDYHPKRGWGNGSSPSAG